MKRVWRILSLALLCVMLTGVAAPFAAAAVKNSVASGKSVTVVTGKGIGYALKLKKTKVTFTIDTSGMSSCDANLIRGLYGSKAVHGQELIKVTVQKTDGTKTKFTVYNGGIISLPGSANKYVMTVTTTGGHKVNISTSAGSVR